MADGFNGCYDIRCYFYSFNINKPARKIINSIPIELKMAVGAGIGLFISFIGMKGAGIIVKDDATFVGLGDLTNPTTLLAVLVLSLLLY